MRGGGFGSTKEKGIQALAWISFIMAIVGGAALTATFISDWVVAFIGVFPGWVAIVAFAAAFVVMAVDLFVDGTPNQLALYMALSLPTMARAVPGKLSSEVTNLSHQTLDKVNDGLGAWLGTTSSYAVAFTAVAVSLLMARRVIAKGR